MKKCPSCGYENGDGAKFCIECGTRLENAETKPETQSGAVIEAPASENASSSEPELKEETISEMPEKEEERWYYVDNGKSQGPFSRDAFIDLIVEGKLTPVTYVWTRGMKEWTYLKNTDLYASNPVSAPAEAVEEPVVPEYEETAVEESTVDEQPDSDSSSDQQEWYYVRQNRSFGPYSQSVMATYIDQGMLDGSSFVWKPGFKDWERLADTELAQYLSAPVYENSRQGGSFTDGGYGQPNHRVRGAAAYGAPLAPKSIVLYILLSIFTCGIFYLVWMYQLAKDANTIAARQGTQPGCDPALAVILSLFTCELYSIYFYYKEGQTVYQAGRGRVSDNGAILALLGFFLPIAAAAILQDQINTLINDGI